MVKACCGQDDDLVIQAGDNIEIAGVGTISDPLIISAIFEIASILRVLDTSSVDLRLTGGTGPDDPLTLQAFSSVAVGDLSDVDQTDTPVDGDSLVYDASSQTWLYSPPAVAPAGAVNVSVGLSGLGSVPDPIKVDVSGTWGAGSLAGLGGDSTIGMPVYEDSAGKLRVLPVVAFMLWSNIEAAPDFPAYFTPDPSATYTASQILDLATAGNAAMVQGHKIYTAMTSSPTPVSPAPAVGDVFIFPRGS